MKNIFPNILATVVAAGIVANVGIWFRFGERLARIETKIEALTEARKLASSQHE